MRVFERLADKVAHGEPSEATDVDRAGTRFICGLFMGGFSVATAYSAYRLGMHLSDLESIMPASTASDSLAANVIVDAVNYHFAMAHLGPDVIGIAGGVAAVGCLHELRKQHTGPSLRQMREL